MEARRKRKHFQLQSWSEDTSVFQTHNKCRMMIVAFVTDIEGMGLLQSHEYLDCHQTGHRETSTTSNGLKVE